MITESCRNYFTNLLFIYLVYMYQFHTKCQPIDIIIEVEQINTVLAGIVLFQYGGRFNHFRRLN